MCFGYDVEYKKIYYSLFDKNKKLQKYLEIPMSTPKMIHDFPHTAKHVVFPVNPIEFNPLNFLWGKFVFVFNPKSTSRYGVMHRHNEDPSKIMWFDLPAHCVFHFVNSWEEVNQKGETEIILFGCALDNVDLNFEVEHPFMMGQTDPKLTKFVLNLSTGNASMEQIAPHLNVEFPTVNPRYSGKKNKFAYMGVYLESKPKTQKQKDNVNFGSFMKVDLENKKIIKRVSYGPNQRGGEVLFQERPNPRSEDDGYLMTYLYDIETELSYFVVWDALTLDEVMRARCP